MTVFRAFLLALLIASGPVYAQDDDLPNAQDLADATAKRFPQPVRVGDLLGRSVLEPIESMPTLGRVHQIVKLGDGTLAVVMDYGGFLGFGTRLIAVPVNGMVLLGQVVEVMDFEPEQLERFPTFNPAGSKPLPPSAIIRVGLAKPSH
jgi:hypothetical protein